METVYIETTVVSFLVAKASRDVEIAGQQQTTWDWWQTRRKAFQCVTSEETLAEICRGDSEQAALRMEAMSGMPVLPVTREVADLAADFLRTGSLPASARSDAVHLAVATRARIEYLLTWNCRHLANAQILRRLEREAVRYGWELPTVCTPLELMGELGDEETEPNS